MALTRQETQVTWPTAVNSIAVAAASAQLSELVTLDATCIDASITLKALNGGTPASGDTVDFYLATSSGDPDGAAAYEYPANVAHMRHLGRIDTNLQNPDVLTVKIPSAPVNGYVYAVNNASANSITVSATIEEQRAA